MCLRNWVQKRNSKKAAAMLRRLLTVDEKELPGNGIVLTYEKTILEETAKKQAAAYCKQINKVASAQGIHCLNEVRREAL